MRVITNKTTLFMFSPPKHYQCHLAAFLGYCFVSFVDSEKHLVLARKSSNSDAKRSKAGRTRGEKQTECAECRHRSAHARGRGGKKGAQTEQTSPTSWRVGTVRSGPTRHLLRWTLHTTWLRSSSPFLNAVSSFPAHRATILARTLTPDNPSHFSILTLVPDLLYKSTRLQCIHLCPNKRERVHIYIFCNKITWALHFDLESDAMQFSWVVMVGGKGRIF